MKTFEHSKSRLESFSDAVFGFAATLLVVSLEIPENFELLLTRVNGYIPFGLTFFVLIMIWKLHYNYFRRIEKIDNWIIAFNMFMIFMLLFYVYPLKFLTNLAFGIQGLISIEDFSTLFQLYSLGFAMMFISLVLLYWRSSKIETDPKRVKVLAFYTRHFGIFVLVSLVSILLARWMIGLRWGFPGVFYGVLGPLCYLHGRIWGLEE